MDDNKLISNLYEQNASLSSSSNISSSSTDAAQALISPYKKSFYKNKKILIIVGIILALLIIVAVTVTFAIKLKPKTITLTKDDMGTTIHVKKGDIVVISTKTISGLVPKIELTNPSVISEGGEKYDENGQFTGKFVASKDGKTNLLITGSPPCEKGALCMPYQLVIYNGTVIVDK